jgi:putative membrane protein
MGGASAGRRYPLTLLGTFAVIFVALGIAPGYRQDWLLENLLVFALLVGLIATYRRFRFSNLAYTFLFVFMIMHEIGAHYTYSLVPYDAWIAKLTGVSLAERFGLARNYYDRLIHFAYGLLVLLPAVELLDGVAPPTGVWRVLLPTFFILSHSALYELIEAAAAMVFGGNLGAAYLGTQGDQWDSQKDMACAAVGAVLAMAVVAATARSRRIGARAERWQSG